MTPWVDGSCWDSGQKALGGREHIPGYRDISQWLLGYPLFSDEALGYVNETELSYHSHLVSSLQPSTFDMKVHEASKECRHGCTRMEYAVR